MSDSKKYVQAESCLLKIADFEFDALRIKDTGEYRMSQAQILKPIGVGQNWFSELDKRNTNRIEALKRKGFTDTTVELRYHINGKAMTAKARPLSDVVIVWRYFDKQGNEKAEALIELLTEDSLQDRFEQLFNERRSQEQRHEWDKMTYERLMARKTWTDIVKQRQERDGYYLTAQSKEEFRDMTAMINKRLFGQNHFYGNRNTMTVEQQRKITCFETFMACKAERNLDLSAWGIVAKSLKDFCA